MGAEAHAALSLGRSTQEREVLDYAVLEELARIEFHLADHEPVTAEDLLEAYRRLRPGRRRPR